MRLGCALKSTAGHERGDYTHTHTTMPYRRLPPKRLQQHGKLHTLTPHSASTIRLLLHCLCIGSRRAENFQMRGESEGGKRETNLTLEGRQHGWEGRQVEGCRRVQGWKCAAHRTHESARTSFTSAYRSTVRHSTKEFHAVRVSQK